MAIFGTVWFIKSNQLQGLIFLKCLNFQVLVGLMRAKVRQVSLGHVIRPRNAIV